MSKRHSYEIKEKILLVVREAPSTYAQLERKINTGFRTIKSNCSELEMFGQVSITKSEKHPSNGKPSYKVSITPQGATSIRKRKSA